MKVFIIKLQFLVYYFKKTLHPLIGNHQELENRQ